MGKEYKRLAALRPADTAEAELYAPASGEEAIVNVIICNQDASTRTYRLAHTDASGTATGEDWIVYDKEILAHETHQITGISIKNPETLRCQASVADLISFVVSGLLIS